MSHIRPLLLFATNQHSLLNFLVLIQTCLPGRGKLFACQEALNVSLHLLWIDAWLVAADRNSIRVHEKFLRVVRVEGVKRLNGMGRKSRSINHPENFG